jgi:hypothetical protein
MKPDSQAHKITSDNLFAAIPKLPLQNKLIEENLSP